nr:ribonuclease H-like domain-containing protein [Tanacetum cinerariifolium]
MIELCRSKGIKREYSNLRTPQQNRIAERKNRTLIEVAKTMLANSKLPTMFWIEAVRTACYVLNRVSITSPYNKTPYALLTGNIPTVSHFKPFGCHVTILNTSDHLGKFDGKADEGYIVGYSASNKAYRVYNVPNKRVEETMNLWFFEDKPNVQGLGHEWYFNLDYLTDFLGYKHVSANQSAGTQGNTINSIGIQDADSESDYDEQVIIVPSYPSNSVQESQPIDTPGDKFDDSPFSSADEIFQKELAKLKDQEQRVTSDVEELRTPAGVKDVLPGCIPVPTGRVPVPASSFPVPTAYSMFDGEPTTRFPCPFDLGNHNPSPVIFSSSSYDDEFDTALNNVASSMEVSLVPTKRIHTIHPQSLIIRDPTSVVQTRSMVKQNTTGDSAFISSIFDQQRDNHTDFQHCKYAIGTKWILKNKRDARGIVLRNKARLVAQGYRLEDEELKRKYMSLNLKVLWILNIPRRSTRRGTIDKTFFLKKNNRDIILEILYKFDLGNVRTATTPYEAPKPKSKSESDSPVNVHLYRSMIGSLMYLIALKPDIMFAVSACLRHQVTPTTSNLEAVKKIFKYLKGQPKLGLWYPKESPLVLEAYSDSDYAGANKDMKSTTGRCQFLADDGGVTDLPIPEIYSGMDALGYVTEDKLTFFKNKFSPQWRGMVNNIGNAKKFLMYPRFLQTILGNPIPLLPAMLLQAQAGESAKVAAQDVPHPHDHSSAQPDTGAGSFPTMEDAPLGGNFHTSPSRSSHTPPAGQPLGGAEDPITLMALSSVVSTLVQKVHSLEAELHDHKKLFKDAVGKLVKKVKTLEVKLKTKKRKMVVSDSDEEDGTTPNVDLDALRALANAAVVVDSDVPSGSTSQIPTASPCAPSVTLTAASVVPADSLKVPVVVLADSPNVPASVSSKGKSPMVEEDIPVTARSFRQREEDRLCSTPKLGRSGIMIRKHSAHVEDIVESKTAIAQTFLYLRQEILLRSKFLSKL